MHRSAWGFKWEKNSSLFCWDCSPEFKGNKYLLMARPGAQPAKAPCPSHKEVLGALWRSGGLPPPQSFSSPPHFLESERTYTEENPGPHIIQALQTSMCILYCLQRKIWYCSVWRVLSGLSTPIWEALLFMAVSSHAFYQFKSKEYCEFLFVSLFLFFFPLHFPCFGFLNI